MSNSPFTPIPEQRGSDLKVPILFGLVLALLAANVYLFLQIEGLRKDMAKNREALLTEIVSVRETSAISTQTARRHAESLKTELDAARRRVEQATGQVKEENMKQVAELEKKIESEQKKAAEATAQVKQDLTKVEQSAIAANTKAAEIVTDVGKVRQEVATAKSEIDKTINDLKSVRGDLGVQSGLIATNAKELAALRSLGERAYFEFNLVKSKQPVKISDVTLQLKAVDIKKNKYTLELVADDKKVEKKDKFLNEPVQFYMARYGKFPCELVVNQVSKDRIVGYLSQPKVTAARN